MRMHQQMLTYSFGVRLPDEAVRIRDHPCLYAGKTLVEDPGVLAGTNVFLLIPKDLPINPLGESQKTWGEP